MSKNLSSRTVRLPKDLLNRIDQTAKQLGMKPTEYLRDLLIKTMDEPETIAAEARQTAGQLGDLSELIEELGAKIVHMLERHRHMQQCMATLAAMLAATNGHPVDEANAWAKKLFLD